MFEIGVVYKKNSRLYLAVTDRVLITMKNGLVDSVRPYGKYDPVRQISVDGLCEQWDISARRLDEETLRFLQPSPEGIKPRPRGSRNSRSTEEHLWRERRTIRLAS